MEKTVIITGSGGSLGRVTVKKFLENKYHVIACINTGKKISFDISDDRLSVYELNLFDADACMKLVNDTIDSHQRIDCALLLAGAFEAGDFISTTASEIEKQIQLNFFSAFNIAQPVFEKMRQQGFGGKIILIGSKPGLSANYGKGSVAYGLSKSLVFRLADVINMEGKGKNITASVIVPGTMDTINNRQSMPDSDFSKWVNPDDVASAMAYLCSESGNVLRETVLKVYGNS